MDVSLIKVSKFNNYLNEDKVDLFHFFLLTNNICLLRNSFEGSIYQRGKS